jgi:hypothetical protein
VPSSSSDRHPERVLRQPASATPSRTSHAARPQRASTVGWWNSASPGRPPTPAGSAAPDVLARGAEEAHRHVEHRAVQRVRRHP